MLTPRQRNAKQLERRARAKQVLIDLAKIEKPKVEIKEKKSK